MSVFRELEYEIAQDCEANGIGVFSPADPTTRTIFISDIPDDSDADGNPLYPEVLLIVPVPSPPPHEYIDTEYPVLDFWSRSPHSDRSKALLRQVFDLYHRRNAFTTTNWRIYNSHALGNIVDVDRDAEGGKLYRLSVQFRCRNLTHIS